MNTPVVIRPVGQPLTRRGFFGLLAGAATAAVVPWQRLLPPRLRAVDRQTGIAMRFIKCYDIQAAQRVHRLDVFYGLPMPAELACRVEG